MMVGKCIGETIINDQLYLVQILSDVSHIIQHEKDADTVLICHGSEFL